MKILILSVYANSFTHVKIEAMDHINVKINITNIYIELEKLGLNMTSVSIVNMVITLIITDTIFPNNRVILPHDIQLLIALTVNLIPIILNRSFEI
ncbi:MAG: hypothetical protein FH761_09685 [Firmicutes bacterium]|nr:hypothetical protein [Bacillota bacterium]